RIHRSMTSSSPCAGSMTRPFVMRSVCKSPLLRGLTTKQVQYRHAHRQAVGDLLKDGRVWAVGNFGSDLDAPVDRSRRQKQDVWLGAAQTLAVHPEQPGILVDRRE